MASKPTPIRDLIRDLNLLDPALSAADLQAGVAAIQEQVGCAPALIIAVVAAGGKKPDLHELIQAVGLGDPRLPAKERALHIRLVADAGGVSLQTVYNHLERVQRGLPARKARSDRGAIRSLSPEALKSARGLCISKPKVSTANLLRKLQSLHPTETLSYASVARVREQVKAELATFQGKPFSSITVERPNERWEMDCAWGDFFCVHPKTGQCFRPQLTVYVDSATDSIMYARYSAEVPYKEVGECLFHAIKKQSDLWPQHGLPESLIMDNGKVMISENLKRALLHLRIDGAWAHPYYPQDKPHVERTIGTVHSMFEQLIPSYTGPNNKGENNVDPNRDFRQLAPGVWVTKDNAGGESIPTLAEANALLWDWISGFYNHQHCNRGLAAQPGGPGMTCLDAWNAGWHQAKAQPRIYDEGYLTQACLPSDLITVNRGRLRVNHLDYTDEALLGAHGKQYEVRFDPADIRDVYVYEHGWPICTAKVDTPFLHTAPQELAAWKETRQQMTDHAKQRRQAKAAIRGNPAEYADLTHLISAAVAAAPVQFSPDATLEPSPTPGYTQVELDELADLTIGGQPIIRRAAGQ